MWVLRTGYEKGTRSRGERKSREREGKNRLREKWKGREGTVLLRGQSHAGNIVSFTLTDNDFTETKMQKIDR